MTDLQLLNSLQITNIMSFLEINQANVGFGPVSNRTEVLSNINLSVEENEFVAVIGFSGAGKSTLMNLFAGLQKPDSGTVTLKGEVVKEPGPQLGLMFQNYSLLPWLSVFENIELAVKTAFPKLSKAERKDSIMNYIDMVKLSHAVEKKPHELSGGMTRSELQDQILNIWETDKRTVVMITNDVDEAVLMADRIVPLTIGPGATLAEEFKVNMERPRDRHTLNDHPEFMRLKSEITSFMMGLNKESKANASNSGPPMPDVKPKDFSLPSARLDFRMNSSHSSVTQAAVNPPCSPCSPASMKYLMAASS